MLFTAVVFATVGLAGCNDKTTESETSSIASDSSLTSVSAFSLKAKSTVCAHLDSVYFSIDLGKQVIFNADSLPMGSSVKSLVPIIGYPSNASAVTIKQTGGVYGDKTIDYLTNPSDTVDFTGKVTLTITAADGVNSRSYRVKVNVHTLNPDSIIWRNESTSALPSRLADAREQRTIEFDNKVVSLIAESDGSYTLAETSDLRNGVWDKQALTLGFVPKVRTLTSTSDALYILDAAGKLYSSADGASWSDTGAVWSGILGGYENLLLGLREDSGRMVHTSYPAAIAEKEIEDSFPVSGYSNMLCFSSSWSPYATAIIAGGRKADGTLSNKAWGFDGEDWAELTAKGNEFEATEDAALVPYFMYRQSAWLWYQAEQASFMLIGGKDEAGNPTRNVYYTINNGVTWTAAADCAAMPETMPAGYGLDGVVVTSPMSGSLTDVWAERPARLHYEIDNYEVSWECPYIYLFGGIGADGKLIRTVRSGLLARLGFMPMI